MFLTLSNITQGLETFFTYHRVFYTLMLDFFTLHIKRIVLNHTFFWPWLFKLEIWINFIMFFSIWFLVNYLFIVYSVFPDDILEEMSSHKFDNFNNESGKKNLFYYKSCSTKKVKSFSCKKKNTFPLSKITLITWKMTDVEIMFWQIYINMKMYLKMMLKHGINLKHCLTNKTLL